MNKILQYTGFILLWAFIGTACSTTSRLTEDEVLYTGVKKISIESTTGEKIPGNVQDDVKEPLSVAPNNPLYSPYIRTPFPVGLWVYNHFYTEKEKGLRHWIFRKLAKTPVLVSAVQPELRTKMVNDILANHGYFGAASEYELLYRKNNKKAKISYQVQVPAPWTYNYVDYPAITNPATRMIDSLKTTSPLKPGAQYSIDTLNMERIRITNILRNNGYYYFRPEYLEYQADTTQQRLKVDMRMMLKKGIPPLALKPYTIGEVNIALQNVTPQPLTDTMRYNGITIAYHKPLKIRPRVLTRSLEVSPGETYTVAEQNATLTNLNKLGIFRYVNLNVTPLDSLNGANSLNIAIDAAFDTPLESEFEVDVSSKSNSFIGPGLIFGVSNKNIFHGGEIFSVRFNGNYEWQTGNKRQETSSTLLNSYEFGLNSSLSIPRLFAPRFIPRSTKYGARTTFQLGADLMNRPKFFNLMSFNFSAGYDFQTSPTSFHNLALVKLTYNNLLHTTESFDETMAENPAIALSFKDQFIPATSYTYTYDQSYGTTKRDRFIWQNSITVAGNLFSGVLGIFGEKTPKRIFGNTFSQFAKGTVEAKYYFGVGRHNTIATRLLVGAGYAYGNSEVMPYSEQFYIGGANSIRAFTIRSLGPGSYRPPKEDRNGYFDQTGDFKLEANVEFRFRMMGRLNGAVFLDAGNIWLLKDDPKRPGGELRLKGLLNEIALGTGVGLRYDISYLVLRADLGIGIHTPYKNPDKPGYYNIQRFKDGLGFHLAIGYPF